MSQHVLRRGRLRCVCPPLSLEPRMAPPKQRRASCEAARGGPHVMLPGGGMLFLLACLGKGFGGCLMRGRESFCWRAGWMEKGGWMRMAAGHALFPEAACASVWV
eukprot:349707-Chlamydomonas_euryale.AAC.8